jgi:hypothetical protein
MLPLCLHFLRPGLRRECASWRAVSSSGLAVVAFVVVFLAVAFVDVAWGQTDVDPKIAPGGISLKQALEKGLKARRPSEFTFIKLVVEKVEQGKLPSKMVERTFLWARDNKQPHPMPYFERALQIQAKKIGVNLPFTDT